MKHTGNRWSNVLIAPGVIGLLAVIFIWLRLTTPFDGERLVPGEWVFQAAGC